MTLSLPGEALMLAHGALGANYNENLDAVHFTELELARSRWLRGFYEMPETDHGDPAEHYAVTTILEAAGRGHRTIFSLKFPFRHGSFPSPGSAEMEVEIARLDRVLPLVVGKVDILVVGNEPFIESNQEELDHRLNDFYECVASHVIAYAQKYDAEHRRTALYMGSLTRLDLEEKRTPATERWMTFVRETPELEGVDIHPHLPDPESSQDFLDYILPRMRDDQTFLVTEFSLVWYWQNHLEEPVAQAFLDAYGLEAGTKVWEVIREALSSPFSEGQWMEFLEVCPWFMEHSDFLHDQMAMYRGTGRLAVATYGFRQDGLMSRNFTSRSVPWLLNSVFAAYTVQQREHTAAPGFWLEAFRALQEPPGPS